jgi:hypothetical protein
MKTHIRIVAVLHIALGALCLVAALAIFMFLGMAGGIVISQGEHEAAGILAIIAVTLGSFLAVLALPGIIGGWGLYTEKEWARPLVLVLGILHLMNVPLGTALGIYTLWALLREEQPPVRAQPAVSSARAVSIQK